MQKCFSHLLRLMLIAGFVCKLIVSNHTACGQDVSFSREVLPILAENCYACHGPDAKTSETDLRLDTREHLLPAVSLDKPETSQLIERVLSTDSSLLMPPPQSHKKPLSKKQVETLKRWIAQGANWGKHWSFELPKKAAIPENGFDHPVDAFVNQRLKEEGVSQSKPAPLHTLMRRLAFDLTGLPPDEAALNKVKSRDDLPTYIDELLASPQYGERMAMWWLDVARYSDTDGFQADSTRENWPWRDWVVDAFNHNMPFDRFTLEQFAGDLLPDATDDQRLATCFHRNHMTNGEGGRDPEESRVDYVIDRVNTMGTVWLGLTLGCCQCHTHKFDPISQADYYSLSAFFNSIDESGKAGKDASPFLKYKSTKTEHALKEAEDLVAERKPIEAKARQSARPEFENWLAQTQRTLSNQYRDWQPLEPNSLESTEGTQLESQADGSILAGEKLFKQDDYQISSTPKLKRLTGFRLEVLPDPLHTEGKLSRGESGEFILTEVKLYARERGNSQIRDVLLRTAVADFSADKKENNGYGLITDTLDDDPRNGWSTKGASATEKHVAQFILAEPLVLGPKEEAIIELRHRSTLGNANIGRFKIFWTDQLGEGLFNSNSNSNSKFESSALETFAKLDPEARAKIDEDLKKRLFEQFLEDYQPYLKARQVLARAEKQLDEIKNASKSQNVMVLSEKESPRDTFVLVRGVWDKHGDQVQPGVPSAIAAWPEDQPRTRIGLANWLVSRNNPLTARVLVNHVWQMLFGQGLVVTQEDFGIQGDIPIHADLLDWLAVDFMEHQWDVKRLVRLIVTSQTYQQDSSVSPEAMAKDPKNRLLARGARFRLASWMLRDAALKTAELISLPLGGPPVRPYQPDGVWEELFMGRYQYLPSEGAAQYRRTLYAFWRRSIAPTFLFDTAQRRSCEVRVGRTNTPLQALTMWNDATYLECSAAIALLAEDRMKDPQQRAAWIFQRVLSRSPDASEQQVLQRELSKAKEYYEQNPAEASKLLTRGQLVIRPEAKTPELAAHTVLASMLLNLDEAMTHE